MANIKKDSVVITKSDEELTKSDEELPKSDEEYIIDSDCSEECITEGCTDPKALNYDISAIDDDGSCVYK